MTKSKRLNLVKSKWLNLVKFKKLDLNFAKTSFFRTDFFILKTKNIFIHLQKAFIKILILYYFQLKYYIQIKINTLSYAINTIFSQIVFDQSFSNYIIYKNFNSNFSKSKIGQWHLIDFFSKKIFLAKTYSKTYNQELLAIIKVFKICHHYLESCKYEILDLINHNNIY